MFTKFIKFLLDLPPKQSQTLDLIKETINNEKSTPFNRLLTLFSIIVFGCSVVSIAVIIYVINQK